jgi:hypothetical protein
MHTHLHGIQQNVHMPRHGWFIACTSAEKLSLHVLTAATHVLLDMSLD